MKTEYDVCYTTLKVGYYHDERIHARGLEEAKKLLIIVKGYDWPKQIELNKNYPPHIEVREVSDWQPYVEHL